MMDIEAIRERNQIRSEYMSNYPDWCSGEEAVKDCQELLDYILQLETEKKELESRLRWKKVEEEKPPLNEELLIKRGCFAKPFITVAMCRTYSGFPGPNEIELVWKYRDGASYTLQPNDEWREII